jgi:hypothetical protein
MTNLLESITLVKHFMENDLMMQRTRDFFKVSSAYKKIFSDQIDAIREIQEYLNQLTNKFSAFGLTDGEYEVNYMMLVDSIKNGTLNRYYLECKSIRAEMISITNANNLEEFKKLNEYWEQIELSIGVIIR